MEEEFLTIEETANRLKISKITVYRMARKKQLPAVKFGKVWRISSVKLAELFESKSDK